MHYHDYHHYRDCRHRYHQSAIHQHLGETADYTPPPLHRPENTNCYTSAGLIYRYWISVADGYPSLGLGFLIVNPVPAQKYASLYPLTRFLKL